jgi:hypothetical protein
MAISWLRPRRVFDLRRHSKFYRSLFFMRIELAGKARFWTFFMESATKAARLTRAAQPSASP